MEVAIFAVDLCQPETCPEGWWGMPRPVAPLSGGTAVYELHMRDFSVKDQSVPKELRYPLHTFEMPRSLEGADPPYS